MKAWIVALDWFRTDNLGVRPLDRVGGIFWDSLDRCAAAAWVSTSGFQVYGGLKVWATQDLLGGFPSKKF